MKIQSSISFIVKTLYVQFFLIVISLLTSTPGHAAQEEEYLKGAMNRILSHHDSLFYDFRDLVFKKYCPPQFSEMNEHVMALYKLDFRTSQHEQRGQKNRFIAELLEECENKNFVLSELDRFNNITAEMIADLSNRIGKLMFENPLSMDFEKRVTLVDQIIDVELKFNFQVEKIFKKLNAADEDQSQINLEFLVKQSKKDHDIHLFDGRDLEALASAFLNNTPTAVTNSANITKKIHCSVCHKKLNLVEAESYQCRCKQHLCAQHRPAEEHSCSFDYKTAQRAELKKHNPQVIAKKVPSF